MPKKSEWRDPLGIFFRKQMSHKAEKSERGDPLVSPRYCMLRRKKGKRFLVQFPGPTGTISNFVALLVELFWSLEVYRKKSSDEKP